MSIWSFLIAAIAAVAAIVIAFFILWKNNPIKSAFAGLTASLIVLTGGLGSQSIKLKASMPNHDVFGFPIVVKEFVITGTPAIIWITAFLAIAALLAWFGQLIANERKTGNTIV
ncbi:MAG: hypothetical protein GY874_01015 [Desulfobacteraceae bacterium]|nr:hypothetical protein [Desulfobacteraceae bacterium]